MLQKSNILLPCLVGGATALTIRQNVCSFHISLEGTSNVPVGQFETGQTRGGANEVSSSFNLNGNTLIDGQGRGCWWTPPTLVLQCDVGQVPQPGFDVGCDGLISYNGQTTFYKCETGSNGLVMIYLEPNGSECGEITLHADSCYQSDCSGTNPGGSSLSSSGSGESTGTGGSSTGSSGVPGESNTYPGGYPTSTSPDSGESGTYPGGYPTETPPGTPGEGNTPPGEYPTGTAPDQGGSDTVPGGYSTDASPGSGESGTYPGGPGGYPTDSLPGTQGTPGETDTAPGGYPTGTPPGQGESDTLPGGYPTETPPGQGQSDTYPDGYPTNKPSTPGESDTNPGNNPPVTSSSPGGPGEGTYPGGYPTGTPGTPGTPGQTGTYPDGHPTGTYPGESPSNTPTSPGSPGSPGESTPPGGGTYPGGYPTGTPGTPGESNTYPGGGGGGGTYPTYTSTGGESPDTTSNPGSPGESTHPSDTSPPGTPYPTAGGGGESCPGGLLTPGSFEYPHLIVPLSNGVSADNTSYFGEVGGPDDLSTAFNFDIPTADAGKTCTATFYFPTQAQLETSSFNFTGSGAVEFARLVAALPTPLPFSLGDLPAEVPDSLRRETMKPGNNYALGEFPCPAGEGVAFVMRNQPGGDDESTALRYFQDYNPCPIGLFITVS